jgi:hypothetical protein
MTVYVIEGQSTPDKLNRSDLRAHAELGAPLRNMMDVDVDEGERMGVKLKRDFFLLFYRKSQLLIMPNYHYVELCKELTDFSSSSDLGGSHSIPTICSGSGHSPDSLYSGTLHTRIFRPTPKVWNTGVSICEPRRAKLYCIGDEGCQ